MKKMKSNEAKQNEANPTNRNEAKQHEQTALKLLPTIDCLAGQRSSVSGPNKPKSETT